MNSKNIISAAAVAIAGAAFGGSTPDLLNWRKDTYEAKPPMLYQTLAGAKATATGQFGGCRPELAIDGNTNTAHHWGCEQLPSALTIELPQPQNLTQGHIWMYYGDDRVYKFYVERSMDGKNWVKVADWTNNQTPCTAKGFALKFDPAGDGKFIRITVTDSTRRRNGAHIVEFSLSSPETYDAMGISGLHGRVACTERINAKNAVGCEQDRCWRASGWRNERVNGQFVLWSGSKLPQLRLEASDLTTDSGKTIPAAAVNARFVRYTLADGKSVGDILDTAKTVDLPDGGFRPIWITVTVPKKAAAGVYRGALKVTSAGNARLEFPLELTVQNATLPDPRDWRFNLDLWQHPFAVARYHGVEPFSDIHYQLMEPLWRELANAGQKAVTTTLTDLPWNHQNFDPYLTMVEHVKQPDGTWKNDYTIFDEYVKFCKKCGLGPEIHCYTMATWGNMVSYTDGLTGDKVRVRMVPGTPEHEAFWGPFLEDFAKHLKKRGWLKDTYIAMDERGRAETKATVECVRKYAPGLKVTLAGNIKPSSFSDIALDSYAQSIGHVDDAFVREIQTRRDEGKITMFYICCGPARPNTFTQSPTAEQVWLGYFAAAKDFDGMLRWAFANWPRDPIYDTGFGGWPAGDTFLFYPGGRSSVRWEMLRDGIEEYEKINQLRKSGADMAAIDAVLEKFDFRTNVQLDDAGLAALVNEARTAVRDAVK